MIVNASKKVYAIEDKRVTVTSDQNIENTSEGKASTTVDSTRVFNLNDWTYTETGSSITLTRYNGTSTELYIPGEFNSKQIVLKDFNFLRTGRGVNFTSLHIEEVNGTKVKLQTSTLENAFYYPSNKIATMDLTGLDVSNVTDMNHMFNECRYLTYLDVSNWDTSNVQNMSNMFRLAKSLTHIDVSNWNISNVTNMHGIFTGARALENIDVSKWNTSNVTDMSDMFAETAIKYIDVSNWDTSKVTNMGNMFTGTKSLKKLDVSNWDTSNVTQMYMMFSTNISLEELDVSNWNTSKVTTMSGMFAHNRVLTHIDVSKWDTSNVERTDSMFFETRSLTLIDASNWDTSKVTNMANMFKVYTPTPLLVITTDSQLINYDYKKDNRLAAEPTFDTNGGMFSDGTFIARPLEIFTIEDSSEVAIHKKLAEATALVETPTKVNSYFNGWNNLNTSTNIVEQLNTIFLANWSINSYKVEFDSQGGSKVDGLEVAFDSFITKPVDPIKNGYTFEGWYTDTTFTTPWNFDTDKMPAHDVILYAKWSEKTSVIVPTPELGGTVVNPDDSTITITPDDKIESNGPIIINPDESIVFPNGGTITKPDGTIETIPSGGVLLPNEIKKMPAEDTNTSDSQTIGVQTGDKHRQVLWITLVGLSAGIMIFFTKRNRKKE